MQEEMDKRIGSTNKRVDQRVSFIDAQIRGTNQIQDETKKK